MALQINLKKYDKEKKHRIISVGLKWDRNGVDEDVDLFAIQLIRGFEYNFYRKIIYFNNIRSIDPYGSTRLTQQNTTGRFDDEPITWNQEVIISDLYKTNNNVYRILYCAACEETKPFNEVLNCKVDIVDLTDDLTAIYGVDITNTFSDNNACVFYEANKVKPDIRKPEFNWELSPVEIGFTSGMRGLLEYYYNYD